MTNANELNIRPARLADSNQLCALLNEIIEIGGTTASQVPLSEDEFSSKYIMGADNVSCFVAEAADGSLLGFQWLTHSENLPDGWGDIATFAKANSGVRGVGTALFEKTRAAAQAAGLNTINATIRADNVSGLGYYSKMGFADYNVVKDAPLHDGTLVDRVQKKHSLI